MKEYTEKVPLEILTARSWQSAGDDVPSGAGHSSAARPDVSAVAGGHRDAGGLARHGLTVGRLRVALIASATQRQPATSHLEPEKYSAAHDDHQRRPQHADTRQHRYVPSPRNHENSWLAN